MDIQDQIDYINNNDISPSRPKKKKKWWVITLQVLLSILLVLGVAFSVFSIIYREIEVIGPSMQPTFNNNIADNLTTAEYEASDYKDKVCVNRFKNGTRGDIIVFKRNGKNLIKRIIAIGGDTIDLKQCPERNNMYTIYVNDEALVETYIKDANTNIMHSRLSAFFNLKNSLGYESYDPIVVPEDYVFVLGDNRTHSEDSISFGFVSRSDIVGRVDIIIPYDVSIIQYYWIKIKSFFGVKN